MLCCGYTLTDFPISIRLTSLALWQSNDCPSASKATLMNMDIFFMWIHYERLHNHNKAKHNKTVCIFLGIYCISTHRSPVTHICVSKLGHQIVGCRPFGVNPLPGPFRPMTINCTTNFGPICVTFLINLKKTHTYFHIRKWMEIIKVACKVAAILSIIMCSLGWSLKTSSRELIHFQNVVLSVQEILLWR